MSAVPLFCLLWKRGVWDEASVKHGNQSKTSLQVSNQPARRMSRPDWGRDFATDSGSHLYLRQTANYNRPAARVSRRRPPELSRCTLEWRKNTVWRSAARTKSELAWKKPSPAWRASYWASDDSKPSGTIIPFHKFAAEPAATEQLRRSNLTLTSYKT